MNSTIKKASVMGALCCPLGILIGVFVAFLAEGDGYRLFPVYGGGAAFITAAFFWWLIVLRRDAYRRIPGAVAGALSSIVAHYICWYFQVISANVCFWIFGGCRSSFGEPPVDLLGGLLGALGLTFFSLLFWGWITAPLGALIGFLLAPRQLATTNIREGNTL